MKQRQFERVAIRLSRDLFGQLVTGDRAHGIHIDREFWCLAKMTQPGKPTPRGEVGPVYVLGKVKTHRLQKPSRQRSTYRYPGILMVLDPDMPFSAVVDHPRVKLAQGSEIGKLFEVLRGIMEGRKEEISGHDMIRLDIALAEAELRMSEALETGGAVSRDDIVIAPAKKAVGKRELIAQKRRVYRPAPGTIHYARAVAETHRFLKFCATAARSRSEILVRVTANRKFRLSATVKKKPVYLKLEMAKVDAQMPFDLDVRVDPLVLANDVIAHIDRGVEGFVGINVFAGGVACTMVVMKDRQAA